MTADTTEPTGARAPLPLVFEAPRRAAKPPRHLADLTREQARAAVAELGHPAFRADQLARHFYAGVGDPAAMTDLPAAVRADLVEAMLPGLLTVVRHQSADGGRTRKTLWRLHDGALVESVLMRYPDRATVCISSQAGCGMACPFCATGQGGLTRNLSAAEIIGQAVAAAAAMASGEIPAGRAGCPTWSSWAWASRWRTTTGCAPPSTRCSPGAPRAGLAQRSVTVSTVGLVPAIHRLTEEGLNVTLAVSLHAPDDELRDTLVPVNTRWNVTEVLEAADAYARRTGRRYSIEYALIRDVNDQPFRADLLGRRLAKRLAHVNLIPLNPTPGASGTPVRCRPSASSWPGCGPTAWRRRCATPAARTSTARAVSSRPARPPAPVGGGTAARARGDRAPRVRGYGPGLTPSARRSSGGASPRPGSPAARRDHVEVDVLDVALVVGELEREQDQRGDEDADAALLAGLAVPAPVLGALVAVQRLEPARTIASSRLDWATTVALVCCRGGPCRSPTHHGSSAPAARGSPTGRPGCRP